MKNRFWTKRIPLSLMFLLIVVGCPAWTSNLWALSPGDLPGPGEELVITTDDVLTIPERETAELGGTLIVQGSGTLQIENRGDFTINGSIENDNAVVNFANYGTLNMNDARIENVEGKFNLANNGNGKWNINNSLILTTGGGSTNISNTGCIRLCQSEWIANYGGKFNINSLGKIVFYKSYVRASGFFDGQQSCVNLSNGYTMLLNWSHFENDNGQFNYMNNGTFDITNGGVLTTGLSGTTNFSNNGHTRLNGSSFDNVGANLNIDNNGTLDITNGGMHTSSCGETNLLNNGEIHGNGWLVTCECDGGEGSVNMMNAGNVTFNEPFIEGVSVSELTDIDLRCFPQGESCTICINNLLGVIEQADPAPLADLTITDILAPECWRHSQEVVVSMMIENVGEADVSGSYKVRLYIDEMECDPLSETELADIPAAGSTESISFRFTASYHLEPGGYTLYAIVDADGEIQEQDEANNLATIEVLVSVLGDLDCDGQVCRTDLNIILSHRNQQASVCPECDLDGDGMITALDARKLVLLCTRPRCVCEEAPSVSLRLSHISRNSKQSKS